MVTRHFMDKGTFSNIISATVFGAGLVLPAGPVRELVLATGLLAFSGGITNSLAVKMLFDRIPGLAGSGVIPARFRDIRLKVKDVILEHFFSEAYLRQFFAEASKGTDWSGYLKRPDGAARGVLARVIEEKWDGLTAPEVIQPLLDQQFERLMDSSLGGFLLMLGPDAIHPAVGRFVGGFLASMKMKVLEAASGIEDETAFKVEIHEEMVVADLQKNVALLLERKLEELDPATVKKMMEDVIRSHLGWLVVWGNVLGALLGLPAYLLFR